MPKLAKTVDIRQLNCGEMPWKIRDFQKNSVVTMRNKPAPIFDKHQVKSVLKNKTRGFLEQTSLVFTIRGAVARVAEKTGFACLVRYAITRQASRENAPGKIINLTMGT